MKYLNWVFLMAVSPLLAEESKVFYPAADAPAAAAPHPAAPVLTSVLYLLFLGAMAVVSYYLWQRKVVPSRTVDGVERPLEILNTRPLGNRQFLVVVKYRNRELLLGVGQGFITRLDSDAATPAADKAKEAPCA